MENKNIKLYSRKNETGDFQLLFSHLENVSNLSYSFSKSPNTSKLLGLLHDIGKASKKFQDYLLLGGIRGSVPHSLQGAFFVNDYQVYENFESIVLKEIVGMIVSAHHGQLMDGISPNGYPLYFSKLNNKSKVEYCYEEIRNNIDLFDSFDVNKFGLLFDLALTEVRAVLETIKNTYKNSSSAQFAFGLYIKYLYSCLVDADRLDAYLFETNLENRESITNWDYLINIFESNINNFDESHEINKVRRIISEKCKLASERETGIYQLSVPTGGGKTLSSLRFALHHARRYNKKHIIYVIPYLSIIEQTAKCFRDIFSLDEDNQTILEHHSNVVIPDDEEEASQKSLATSRWESPIIITTMIQFLESTIPSKCGKLRKLHNMQDSIIIFDEIQFLPVNSIHLFNEVISFLSKILNTSILLCSATQPLIAYTERANLLLNSNPYLINGVESYFKNKKRTTIFLEKEKDLDQLEVFIKDVCKYNSNCLVIMNTKKTARDLYNKISKSFQGYKVFHLSTSMCLIHRYDIFEKIKECLIKRIKVICISTQLIEAGVDISFECVVRAMAGLDSILQAAGRCNRNGESDHPKDVFVVPIRGENLENLKDIRIGKEASSRVFYENEGSDYSSIDILNKYYDYYFYRQKNIMDYPTDNDESVYEMLSYNNVGRRNFRNETGFEYNHFVGQAFLTADEKYYIIEKKEESVIVNYKNSENLLVQYKNSKSIKDKLAIIKKLEKYSVTLYRDYEYKTLYNNNAITRIQDEFGLQLLDQNFYDDNLGVILEIDSTKLII